jgi:hypothetical protein
MKRMDSITMSNRCHSATITITLMHEDRQSVRKGEIRRGEALVGDTRFIAGKGDTFTAMRFPR